MIKKNRLIGLAFIILLALSCKISAEEGQIEYSSASNNYKYSIKYPGIVEPGQVNKIAITIFNKTASSDKELTIEIRDITQGDGIGRFLQDWDKSAFRVLRTEPKPKMTELILGATYFDYEGLKAKETKEIVFYFKITTTGDYLQKIMFYTDRHRGEEYELVSVATIKCRQ